MSTATPAQTEQTFVLPDGRTLGYAEYGSPIGPAIFYFHGFPSARLEAILFEKIARKRKLRIIAPDRPGFGLSSFQAGRCINDWPADVRALAGHLGLKSFAVLGVSGGGPYALVCAAHLPHKMLTGVGVMAGGPPWEAAPGEPLPVELGPQSIQGRVTSVAADYMPTGLRVVGNTLVGVARWIASTGTVTSRIDTWLESNSKEPEEEEEHLTTKQRRERLIRVLFEAFEQGAGAAVQEAQLLSHDWGFRFEDVIYDKIKIWHGIRDKNAPIRLIRYMAERLPHAELKEYDEDHYSLGKHAEEILLDLVPATPSGSSTEA